MKPNIAPRFFSMIVTVCAVIAFSGCGGGGGGGGSSTTTTTTTTTTSDTTAPILAITYPAANQSIYDTDFFANTFYVEFSYSDANPINAGSIAVSMQMDSGSAVNVSQYFSPVTSTLIRSNALYNYTRTLFTLASNTTTHTIVVTAAARDSAGNLGIASTTFIVPPAPPPQ